MNAMLASRAKAMADRYTVRETRGMGLGAGGFVILDTQEGREFAPVLWRDEADRIAARLNAEDRAIQAERASGVLEPQQPRKATDEEIRAWADRHDLAISSMTALRETFEDAQTLVPAGVLGTHETKENDRG
jgi:hypothetical protein